MMKQILVLAVAAFWHQGALAFDCHSDVPEFPDFDISQVK